MIKLLYSNGSNCSQRVRWALNHKRINYDVIDYSSLTSTELHKLSPLGKVPALVIDGSPFAESVAILEFLEELYPERPLLPLSPLPRAKVREAVEIINGWVHPVQCSSVPRFFLPDLNDHQVREYRKRWLEKSLPVLHDSVLFKESPFAVGTTFTWADLSLIPIYVKALILGVSSDAFPKFQIHMQFCFDNKAHREHCPDDLAQEIIKYTKVLQK